MMPSQRAIHAWRRLWLLTILCLCFWTLSACDAIRGAPTTNTPVTQTPAPIIPDRTPGIETRTVTSPEGRLRLTFALTDGAPSYAVTYRDRSVILPSRLGFTFRENPAMKGDFKIEGAEDQLVDETWTQPWGEEAEIRNHYRELRVDLRETGEPGRTMTLAFRVYDDGLGFRYEIPQQPNLSTFDIMSELTEFVLTDDHELWWIPAYADNRYEYLYQQTRLTHLSDNERQAVHTPLTMRTGTGLYLSIHEAALSDYASMTLVPGDDQRPAYTLECDLVPWSDGTKVKTAAPLRTPWRTIQIAETPGDLITNYLILNLNEPSVLEETDWIRPMKYVGIWWGMHIDVHTWGSGDRHGATTENAQRIIDFAAEHGIGGVLIEGWNVGWDGDWSRHGDRFSFTTPYPDFDLEAVATYAAERGVMLIGHHETGAAIQNYEQQLEAAFTLYQDLGVRAVKTGYVGWGQGIKRRDADGNLVGLEWHHGQWMVRHYRHVVETAARYGIMLNVHEPIKPTGIRRTYPNMMTREGARGQEYNAWSEDGGNPPEHTTILPFTRLLAGPMDFTPGIFDLTFDEIRPENRVNTTLAKQLALYVVLYSPLQMAADLPENYVSHPAFQFIEAVPVDWATTLVPNGEIGDFVTVVRRDRASEDWYLGSITDEAARSLEVALTFLKVDHPYVAEIYADGPNADWERNPYAMEIAQSLVGHNTVIELDLASGGGQAIRFRPATAEDQMTVPAYPDRIVSTIYP